MTNEQQVTQAMRMHNLHLMCAEDNLQKAQELCHHTKEFHDFVASGKTGLYECEICKKKAVQTSGR